MKKYKIGYTTGVFDMFHIGHLNILKRAKEQCDFLIVGISTDELVKSYKHHKPIVPLNQRMEIVAAIKYVDKVVVQDSLDKMEAYKALNFQVIFHGDDWKGSSLYNETEQKLSEYGVETIYLPHTEGVSSSSIRNSLKGNSVK